MQSRTFKEVFASVKPDRPASPALSRAERQAKVEPAVAAEFLEGRRLLSGSARIVSRVLVVDGDGNGNFIELSKNGTVVTVAIDSDDPLDFNPGDFDSASVSGLGGNDTIILDYNDPGPSGHSFTENAWIDGGDGNDSIQGGDFDDTIHGGNGNDLLHGADSVDIIYGDDGNDGLYGEGGDDDLDGGVGYDYADGGDNADVIYGGTGSGANSDSVTGYDSLYGDVGNDIIYGEGGGDAIYGGDGDDTLSGGDFNDFISGEAGADAMYGNEGDDTLDGRELSGSASDVLFGGNGNDCGWWTGSDTAIDMEGNFI
jgi:Ca2+-binding RTX toxin-like protein